MLTHFAIVSLLALVGSSPVRLGPDACALLTDAQVSTVIEAKTQPGKHAGRSSTNVCIWSGDQNQPLDGRQVILAYSPPVAFDVGKQASRQKPEPVSGVGDEAYYQFYGRLDSPALVVK